MDYLEKVDKNLLILFVITTATLLILYVIFSSILSKANKTIYEEKNIFEIDKSNAPFIKLEQVYY